MDARESNAFAISLDRFTRVMYTHLAKSYPTTNLICSPLSMQISAAMLRMGLDDRSESAKEIDHGLKFSVSTVNDIAKSFKHVLSAYEQCSVLQIANKLYIMKEYNLRPEFRELLTESFHSSPDNIDFVVVMEAANTINQWIENKTNKCIRNVVSPNDFGIDTKLVLVNAIHFKGEWTVMFDENQTQYENFCLDSGNTINVSMMNSTNNYDYAELQDLDAKALQMKYRDTSLYMMFILPNKYGGLTELQQGLQWVPLKSIISQLSQQKVSVKLPRFQAEFTQELSELFKQMGIKKIFSSQADLQKAIETKQKLQVSKILHKAFIEVNEKGTEAAAATAISVMLRSAPAPEEPKTFHADHPFYYVIHDENYGNLFVGNFSAPPVRSDSRSDIVFKQCDPKNCERHERRFRRTR